MKKREKVGTYLTQLYCDMCGVEMRMETVLTSYPPKYQYKCPNCFNYVIEDTLYPMVDYVKGEQSFSEIKERLFEEFDDLWRELAKE